MDAGEYSCIATNMMGAVYSTFTICVEGMTFSQNSIETRQIILFIFLIFLAMTEPESTGSEMEERSANVSDADANAVCYHKNLFIRII